jgi:hypothetical protein
MEKLNAFQIILICWVGFNLAILIFSGLKYLLFPNKESNDDYFE